MPALTPAMRTLVDRQRMAAIATVRADGTPRVGVYGTLASWDGDTLVFADILARGAAGDLLENPAIEVAVVDPLRRKGWRFRGTARLLLSGPTFERLRAFYRRRGVDTEVHHMVLIRVHSAEPLVSPVYALGWSEAQVVRRWTTEWRRRLDAVARHREPQHRKQQRPPS